MSQSNTGAWIFQANPEQFNVTAALDASSYVQWSIRQQHLARRIRPGHPVFIWRAKGKSKSDWGIVAIGEVTDLPSISPFATLFEQFSKIAPPFERFGVVCKSMNDSYFCRVNS